MVTSITVFQDITGLLSIVKRVSQYYNKHNNNNNDVNINNNNDNNNDNNNRNNLNHIHEHNHDNEHAFADHDLPFDFHFIPPQNAQSDNTKQQTNSDVLTVLSYNIWNYNSPWKKRQHLIADEVSKVLPDIIAWQEVRYSLWDQMDRKLQTKEERWGGDRLQVKLREGKRVDQ